MIFKDKKDIIIILLSLLMLLFSMKMIVNNKKFVIKSDANIIISNNTDIIYGNIYYVSDFVSITDGVLHDHKIDYNKLGNNVIKYKYDYKNYTYQDSFELNVIDNVSPVVMVNNSITAYLNERDIANKVLCADNYDKNPTCEIVGDYDISKVGDYNVSYIATDINNNITKKDIVLHIREKSNNNNNSSSTSSKTYLEDVIKNYKNDETLIGIDVSRYQGEIDWKKVKNAGVSFVMIRMGGQNGFDGDMFTDKFFEDNINGATQNGIKVGLYYYSYATTLKEAKNQAKWMLNEIKNYKIDLPIVFDWESFGKFNNLNLSLYDITSIQDAFLNVFREAGYDTSRYGSKNYLTNVWLESEHKTWLAHYVKNTSYSGEYYMWQICNNGIVDGINGFVDIDILYDI